MRRSSSAFLLATVAATAATLSSAAPLIASTSSAFDVEVDLTAGDWKMPAFFPVAPALERRGLGDDELVVLSASTSSGGASASISVSASSSSGDEDEVDADEDEDDSAVFDPSSSSADESKVIKNPKLVLNPKNPYYSSTLASISSARATRSAASSSSTTTPAAVSTTTSGKGAAQTQNTWYLVPEAPSQSAATTSLVPSSSSTISSAAPVATTTTTTSSASSSASSPTATTKVYSGGIATYFYQNGNPGNCGDYNQDTAMLVALPTKTYANGKYCGDWLTIKRVSTGQTIQAFVADSCPSCENNSSLDLSLAAFQALEPDLDVGIFDIEWWFNDA